MTIRSLLAALLLLLAAAGQAQAGSSVSVASTASTNSTAFATGAATPSRPVAEPLYDETANAEAEISAGLRQARSAGKNLLLVFGANWCPDCRRLDPRIGARGGPLDRDKFVIVKVDVGNFDRNMALARTFGDPIRKGIPGAAIVAPNQVVLYAGPLSHLAEPGRRRLKFALLAVAACLAAGTAAAGVALLRRRRARRMR